MARVAAFVLAMSSMTICRCSYRYVYLLVNDLWLLGESSEQLVASFAAARIIVIPCNVCTITVSVHVRFPVDPRGIQSVRRADSPPAECGRFSGFGHVTNLAFESWVRVRRFCGHFAQPGLVFIG